MKKKFLLVLFLSAILLQSCRETEMNTDGNMEENETEVGGKQKTGEKHLAMVEDKADFKEVSKMTFFNI